MANTSTAMSGAAKRVLIIGIDGGTFDVLKPQIAAGNMPALGKLLEEGLHGNLRSTLPPITGPAWRTFASGCNPGKHGVIDFVELDPQTFRVHVKDVSQVPVPTFWDELGRHNLPVGIIGVPMTYPPRPVNGFLLTGMMTPPGSDRFTYPPELAGELAHAKLRYPTTAGEGVNASRPVAYLNRVMEDMGQRVDTALYLLEKHQPACSVFVFGSPDPIQHQFFHLLGDEASTGDAEVLDALDRYFQALDAGLARLLSLADDDTLVMLISDHGFGRLRGFIHLNNWLLDNGYLHLQRDPLTRLRMLLHRLGYTPENMYRLARALGVDARRSMNKGRMYGLTRLAFLSFANVDWQRTQAYALGHIGQVYVLRKPGMAQADYERLRDKLKTDIAGMRHPATGEKLVDRVYTRDELYHGPYTESAPDLVLEPAGFEHVAFGESEFASNLLVGPGLHTGHHRMEGILALRGPHLAATGGIEGATIADIAPTVLYALGLPVPRHMDGEPLLASFDGAFVKDNPVAYTDESAASGDMGSGTYSEDEEESVRQRLRDLGYTA